MELHLIPSSEKLNKLFLSARYARQREQDVETLSGFNTMVSYTTGRHIGFTFTPRLVAQMDPSNYNTGPGLILQAQTVPEIVEE